MLCKFARFSFVPNSKLILCRLSALFFYPRISQSTTIFNYLKSSLHRFLPPIVLLSSHPPPNLKLIVPLSSPSPVPSLPLRSPFAKGKRNSSFSNVAPGQLLQGPFPSFPSLPTSFQGLFLPPSIPPSLPDSGRPLPSLPLPPSLPPSLLLREGKKEGRKAGGKTEGKSNTEGEEGRERERERERKGSFERRC